MAHYKIFIAHKDNIFDAEAKRCQKDILTIGIKNIDNLKIYQIYEISGDVTTSEIKKICAELLTDPLTQEYFINSTEDKGCFPVEVYNKNGVTDAVVDTVEIGIKDIGVSKNIVVKSGKKFCLYGKLKTNEIEEIAKKILSNSIIQEYKI